MRESLSEKRESPSFGETKDGEVWTRRCRTNLVLMNGRDALRAVRVFS